MYINMTSPLLSLEDLAIEEADLVDSYEHWLDQLDDVKMHLKSVQAQTRMVERKQKQRIIDAANQMQPNHQYLLVTDDYHFQIDIPETKRLMLDSSMPDNSYSDREIEQIVWNSPSVTYDSTKRQRRYPATFIGFFYRPDFNSPFRPMDPNLVTTTLAAAKPTDNTVLWGFRVAVDNLFAQIYIHPYNTTIYPMSTVMKSEHALKQINANLKQTNPFIVNAHIRPFLETVTTKHKKQKTRKSNSKTP